ncbi:hypothetical protein ASD19_02580 [Microbacterium sp. Root53]|nr:hypothetical protein ASD19_02580 [Microbacterium sp. Root53]
MTPAGAALPARGSRREKSIAVLFDAENIAPAWVGPVLGEVARHGIASSDGDFTRLAARIREDGIPVLGYGERKTPSAFRNACDQFTYFDLLEGATPARERDGATKTSSPGGDAKLVALLRAAVLATADEQGWANLSPVGQHVRKNAPDFDSRNWGFARLSELVKATERFHIKTRGTTIVVADKALVP